MLGSGEFARKNQFQSIFWDNLHFLAQKSLKFEVRASFWAEKFALNGYELNEIFDIPSQ